MSGTPSHLAAESTITGTGYPRRGSRLARWLAGHLLALPGWRVEGELPPLPKFVIIVAPHTTNWDFIIGVLAMFITDVKANWLGKHTIFRFPVAPLLRWIGGEPIDRSVKHGTVETAIERFQTRPEWVLALSPEGTRRRVERWKTGFYRIAVGASVPIVPIAIDYRTRALAIGAPVWPDQDETAGVAKLRALFRKEMARYPERFAEEGRPEGPPPAY
ncbi:MAG: 1-acyl-sn-glycerol-3-phosphate acyltransferase [Gemmatimonadales bacterium]